MKRRKMIREGLELCPMPPFCKVWVCVDRFDAKDGMVWAVRSGKRWISAHTVHCWVDMETVFKGPKARQPRAYLQGYGYVRTDGHGTVTIANA